MTLITTGEYIKLLIECFGESRYINGEMELFKNFTIKKEATESTVLINWENEMRLFKKYWPERHEEFVKWLRIRKLKMMETV